jgi:hypothetical protein
MKMEQTECSGTLAYKIQTRGNHPEGSIQYSKKGESFKLRIFLLCWKFSDGQSSDIISNKDCFTEGQINVIYLPFSPEFGVYPIKHF